MVHAGTQVDIVSEQSCLQLNSIPGSSAKLASSLPRIIPLRQISMLTVGTSFHLHTHTPLTLRPPTSSLPPSPATPPSPAPPSVREASTSSALHRHLSSTILPQDLAFSAIMNKNTKYWLEFANYLQRLPASKVAHAGLR